MCAGKLLLAGVRKRDIHNLGAVYHDSLQFGGESQECFNLLLIFYFGTFYLGGILWYLYFIYVCKSKMYIVGTYMSFSSNVATGVKYVSENV